MMRATGSAIVRWCPQFALCLVTLLGSGCGTTYQRYAYRPWPASTLVEAPTNGEGAVTVLATIIGVRQAKGLDTVVETRFWIANNSSAEVRFPTEELKLFSAGLNQFRFLGTDPARPDPVRPGAEAVVGADFAFPPDIPAKEVDVSALSLAWAIQGGGRTIRKQTHFVRTLRDEYRNYGPPYYSPYPQFNFGFYHWW